MWHKRYPASVRNNILHVVQIKQLCDLILLKKILNIFKRVPSHLIGLSPTITRRVTILEVIQDIRANPNRGTLNCFMKLTMQKSPMYFRYISNIIPTLQWTCLQCYQDSKPVHCTTILMHFSLFYLDITVVSLQTWTCRHFTSL